MLQPTSSRPTSEEILKAAKIPEDALINPAVILLNIEMDNEVRDRALDIASEAHLLEALSRIRDYAAFHKRIGVPQPVEKPKVSWQVMQFPYPAPGNPWVIKATLDNQWNAIGGTAEQAAKTAFLGQYPPKEIVAEYKRRLENPDRYVGAEELIADAAQQRNRLVGQ